MQDTQSPVKGSQRQSPETPPLDHRDAADGDMAQGKTPAFIVGIGVSAGGLDSLEKFFRSSKDEDILVKILNLVCEETNVDFSYYKPSTIIRRIERRMGVNQIEKMEHYYRFQSNGRGCELGRYRYPTA